MSLISDKNPRCRRDTLPCQQQIICTDNAKARRSHSQADELQVHPLCSIHINDVAWRHPLIVEK